MKLSLNFKVFCLLSVVLMAAKLWLVGAHHLMATQSPHDDFLFVNQAYNILSGNWLGEYDQFTLIKGQFYPIFIVLAFYLGIPLLAAQQLLYGLVSFVFIWAVYPVCKYKWLLFVLFFLLLFSPFSYSYPGVGRAFRLAIYGPLGLLSLSCFIGLIICLQRRAKGAIFWALGAGLALCGFWHTREESIWIVPSLIIIVSFGTISLYRLSRSQFFLKLSMLFLPFIILLGGDLLLKYKNFQQYGMFATIELKTPQFGAAYGGLLRIRSDKWRQFFPVVRDVREKVYAVSPSFKELQPYLEGPVGAKWQELAGTDDLPAGFFIWVLRDSVAAAGYYKDAPSTLAFYQRIGDEIDAACADGILDCRPRYTDLTPPWHKEYNKSFFPTYYSIIKKIASFRRFNIETKGMMSWGKKECIAVFQDVTRDEILTSKRDVLESIPEYRIHLDQKKIRILKNIGNIYKVVIPPLFVLSLGIFLFRGVQGIRNRCVNIFTVSAGAALIGIISIAFILTLLAITSYSEIGRPMHTAYPMVLMFVSFAFLDLLTGEDQIYKK